MRDGIPGKSPIVKELGEIITVAPHSKSITWHIQLLNVGVIECI